MCVEKHGETQFDPWRNILGLLLRFLLGQDTQVLAQQGHCDSIAAWSESNGKAERCFPLEMDIPQRNGPHGIYWPEKNLRAECWTWNFLIFEPIITHRDCLTIPTFIDLPAGFIPGGPWAFFAGARMDKLARSTPGHWLDLPCPKIGHRYTQKPEISTCVWSILPVLPTPKWKESLNKPPLSGKGYALGVCSRGLLKFTQKKERVARMIQRIMNDYWCLFGAIHV